jgi:hypothetical protein
MSTKMANPKTKSNVINIVDNNELKKRRIQKLRKAKSANQPKQNSLTRELNNSALAINEFSNLSIREELLHAWRFQVRQYLGADFWSI